MKWIKRIGITILVLILLVVGGTWVVLAFYKDDILRKATSVAEESIDAKVSIEDVSISLFADFPRITFGFDNLKVDNVGEFEGTTLAEIGSLSLSADLGGILSEPIELNIHQLTIADVALHAIVNKDGKANYDIVKKDNNTSANPPTTTQFYKQVIHQPRVAGLAYKGTTEVDTGTAAGVLAIQIDEYRLENIDIIYDDYSSGMHAEIENLIHTGAGDFTQKNLTLQTQTDIASVQFKQGGTQLVNGLPLKMLLDVNIDQPTKRYTLSKADLSIGGFLIKLTGDAVLSGDDIKTNIEFAAPGSTFGRILQMIPPAFAQYTEGVDTRGSFDFKGDIKGILNSKTKSYPAFRLDLGIQDGYLKYKDLPEDLHDIKLALNVKFPGGKNLDKATVDLSQLHLIAASAPVDLSFQANKLLSKKNITAEVKTDIKLQSLKKALPMESLKDLSGDVDIDVSLRGSLADLEAKAYDKFKVVGNAVLRDIEVSTESAPDKVGVKVADVSFNSKSITLKKLNISIGRNSLSMRGQVENYLLYALQNKPLRGNLRVEAQSIYLDDLMEAEKSSENKVAHRSDNLKTSGIKTEVRKAGFGSMSLFGTENSSKEPINKAPSKNVNDEERTFFQIPEALNLSLNLNIKKIFFQKIQLTNLTGKMTLRNQKAMLDGLTFGVFEGVVSTEGFISTQSQPYPSSFDLNVKNIKSESALNELDFLKKSLGLHDKVSGRVNLQTMLTMDIDTSFAPVLATSNGVGKVQTRGLQLRNLGMLKKLGDGIGIKGIKENPKVSDIKITFSIKDGVVTVDPMKMKVEQVQTSTQGKLFLPDQTMDMRSKVSMPRQYLGKEVNAGIDQALAFAKQNKINISVQDQINAVVQIKGKIAEPSYNILYGPNGEASTLSGYTKILANKALDDAKEEVKKKGLDDVKKKAKNLLKGLFN